MTHFIPPSGRQFFPLDENRRMTSLDARVAHCSRWEDLVIRKCERLPSRCKAARVLAATSMSFSSFHLVWGEQQLQVEAGSQAALIQPCLRKGATQQKTLGRPPDLRKTYSICASFHCCHLLFDFLAPLGGEGWGDSVAAVWAATSTGRRSVVSGGAGPVMGGGQSHFTCKNKRDASSLRRGDGEWPDPTAAGAQTRTSGGDRRPPSRRPIVAFKGLRRRPLAVLLPQQAVFY